jgi:hypothetical protein
MIQLPFDKRFYNMFEICKLLASWRIMFTDVQLLFFEEYFYLNISVLLTHAKSLITMLIRMGYGIVDSIFDMGTAGLFRRHVINVSFSKSLKQ